MRNQVDELQAEIVKLTSLDESVLRAQLAALDDKTLSAELAAAVPGPADRPGRGDGGARAVSWRSARRTVAGRKASPADARRLVDVVHHLRGAPPGAAGAPGSRGRARPRRSTSGCSRRSSKRRTARASSPSASAPRRRGRSTASPRAGKLSQADLAAGMRRVERVVEWAQQSAVGAFAEVWAPWTFLLPQVNGIGDDVLRSSPLLVFADVSRRLDDLAAGRTPIRHDLFGTAVDTGVRALNPGLAVGTLRVAPPEGGYARDEVVALPETPADLEPAAGILTQGEGNVLSHVQLLARALGIPNVVLGPAAYKLLAPHDGRAGLLPRLAARPRGPEGGEHAHAPGARRLRGVHPEREAHRRRQPRPGRREAPHRSREARRRDQDAARSRAGAARATPAASAGRRPPSSAS